jgi:hypothetical protein
LRGIPRFFFRRDFDWEVSMPVQEMSWEWMRVRSAVWVSDRFGLAAGTKDGHWFAYPFGGAEPGPFPTLDDARACLERRGNRVAEDRP